MIGETTFQATARLEADGSVGVKVTAITPYANRTASVSEDLTAEAIETSLANIRAHKKRLPEEISEWQDKFAKSKPDSDAYKEASKNLFRLAANGPRLDNEEAHFQSLQDALAKHGPKINIVLSAVVKDVKDALESKAVREASRAMTTAMDNNEDLKGERTIVRLDDNQEEK
jgi:hypothetical protein